MKRTKIVATIGPASEKKQVLVKMIKAGLNVARLNFSHNVHAHHLMLIRRIREAAKKSQKTITILQDLQGPRIRIGNVGKNGIKVVKGKKIILSAGSDKAKAKVVEVPIGYKNLYQDVTKDDRVLIEDGLIELKVETIIDRKIKCRVMVGGVIKTHKGMNFPDSTIKASPLTEKDITDLDFGIANGVDFVALSFVKDAGDIKRLKGIVLKLEKKHQRIGKLAKEPQTKIIAKIERREAVKNFDQILKVVDGIMVARGDLGIELPFEDVPLIQKEIIKKCGYAGKPVIVATQMLDSMIKNPIPTRAEVSDVANAILDGTDAIMLSGESATGKYPLKAVKAMKRIADEVEPAEFKLQQELEYRLKRIKSLVDSVAFNAQDIAEDLNCKVIVCLTESGLTARMIARYKSKVSLVALTEDDTTRNQLNLTWGVESYTVKFSRDHDKLLADILKILTINRKARRGDRILICAGHSLSLFKKGNYIKLEFVV